MFNNLLQSSVKNSFSTPIPILSFFTGAGFLDMGFMQAGFRTIWSNEYNENFAKGYSYAFSNMTGNVHQISNTSSIVDLGPNQIAKEAFLNLRTPDIFGMIGGPPCPDFSVGGKNRGREGDHGRLSQVYVSRIIELQPTFFLFENVPGLLRTTKHREFFDYLRYQLSHDYLIEYKVLNALDFGVPQDRERVIMVGIKKKWLKKKLGLRTIPRNYVWFHWPEDPRYTNAKTRFNWPGEVPFGSNPCKPMDVPEELMVGSYICDIDEISSLPNGLEGFSPRSNKFTIIPEGDVSRKSFKRLHRWRYSPTVAYGNNEVHLHPTQPRRLSVREALRIQSVSDSYILPEDMALTHKYKTIGNGVAVKVAYAVACSIRKMIEEES